MKFDPDRIVGYGTNLGLDIWDWSAVLLASVSLLVASMTLVSQMRTQRNTQPIITRKIQVKLLLELFGECYLKYVRVYSMYVKMKSNGYSLVPENKFLAGLIYLDCIHEELFFKNKQEFEYIHRLKVKIAKFNIACQAIPQDMQNAGKQRDKQLIDLLSHIHEITVLIVETYFYLIYHLKISREKVNAIGNYSIPYVKIADFSDFFFLKIITIIKIVIPVFNIMNAERLLKDEYVNTFRDWWVKLTDTVIDQYIKFCYTDRLRPFTEVIQSIVSKREDRPGYPLGLSHTLKNKYAYTDVFSSCIFLYDTNGYYNDFNKMVQYYLNHDKIKN